MAPSPVLAVLYRSFDENPTAYLNASPVGRAILSRLIRGNVTRLFEKDQNRTKLPLRDISASGEVTKINLFDDDELRAYLGQIPSAEDVDVPMVEGEQKSDAMCRFVHLIASSSNGPMELSLRMLLRLLIFYQVMPQYLEFLDVYISPDRKNLHFSGFRSDRVLRDRPETAIPALGRSGKRYQLCFELKLASQRAQMTSQRLDCWGISQATIHHQFDLGTGTQLWLIGDVRAAMKNKTAEVYPETMNHRTDFGTMVQCFTSSLKVHHHFASSASSEWRWFVQWLESLANKLTLSPSEIEESRQTDILSMGSLRESVVWQEKMNDVILAMTSNVTTLSELENFYRQLVGDDDFPSQHRQACHEAAQVFGVQISDLLGDLRLQIASAEALVKTLAERRAMITQQLKMEVAVSASIQADRSAKEAVAMRIVTIVTLFYLPATFSCTFFSTDIVKFEDGETFSWKALERFLQVTLPLMALTFSFAGGWLWFERRNLGRTVKIQDPTP